eukprot:CAMPEP_0172197308 /NCGR_PEP_ID=MMETSP1050-20130122/27377_1 /TAXON_ID=233186 /ORGANISM="Cryptomonas curvata, Strain CCAP979/52" /LENGTH=70 /DNA_ID=CAMNT_0012873839 /DNA_START=6 /DNA_END=214 /DNA_ORIENTATION=+
MGCKSAEMLRNVPGLTVTVTEKCSGHGGTWGCKSATHKTARRLAIPALRSLLKVPKSAGPGGAVLASECP